MTAVEIAQKTYEMPPKLASASRIFSPSPTSIDRFASMKRSSVAAF